MQNEMEFIKANYTKCPIKAFQGNPLIEALPPIISDAELIKKLVCMPEVDDDTRKLPSELRRTALVELESFTYPLSEYIEFTRRIESALYRGYSSKNPLLPTFNHYLHYLEPDETPVQPISGRFESRPTGMSIVGPSGAGKNWMFERVLNLYPQLILHKEYKGKGLSIQQIVWLKVECPEDGSLVTFALNFLSAIDDIVGTNEFNDAVSKRINKGVVAKKVERLSRLYSIGVIVIDEFSNLRLPKKTTVDNVPTLHKLILNLMNGSGVPIVFCGNPEMLDVMQLTLKTARRAENGGVITLGQLHPDVWKAMSKRLWKLQLTNEITPWNRSLSDVLYQASRGLAEFAVRGFLEAQRLVIGTGDERLTDTAIRTGVAQAIEFSNKLLDYSVAQNMIDGNWVPNQGVKPNDTSSANNNDVTISCRKNASKRNVELNDPYRPQHPEFYDVLNQMRYNSSLVPSDSKPALIRDAGEEDDLMRYLIEQNVILDDVINLNI